MKFKIKFTFITYYAIIIMLQVIISNFVYKQESIQVDPCYFYAQKHRQDIAGTNQSHHEVVYRKSGEKEYPMKNKVLSFNAKIASVRQDLEAEKKEAMAAYADLEYDRILGIFEPDMNNQFKQRISEAKSQATIGRVIIAARDLADQYFDAFEEMRKAGKAQYQFDRYGDPVLIAAAK